VCSIIIAIDGYSACGKSTLAKAIGQQLGYAYIDTGAMYRATTLYFLRHHINLNNSQAVETALAAINIHFEYLNELNITFLNGENVEQAIRSLEVSNQVSEVAAISAVRRKMVQQQQQMAKTKGFVLDGRDIGTVVFPDAALKIFLTASIAERTRRRFKELQQKGIAITYSEVLENLQHRDHIDSTREDSPLRKADDAILLDNTYLNKEEQLSKVIALVEVAKAKEAWYN
jgi:cytidylate kinase